MDAIKFMKEKKRMCALNVGCLNFPIGIRNNKFGEPCRDFEENHPEDAVAIVEKWSAEHPIKTRQSEFMKIFPDARVNSDGVIDIDPSHLNKKLEHECDHKYDNCDDCYKDYWLSEVR